MSANRKLPYGITIAANEFTRAASVRIRMSCTLRGYVVEEKRIAEPHEGKQTRDGSAWLALGVFVGAFSAVLCRFVPSNFSFLIVRFVKDAKRKPQPHHRSGRRG